MKDSSQPALLPLPGRLARITVEQYHKMIDSGALEEGAPIELLDGLLVYKDRSARGEDPMTVGRRHRLVVQLLKRLDLYLRPHGGHVQIQGPISIPPNHEPEPDGAVVRGDERDYLSRNAEPQDISAVIEVSDSSLQADRTRKLAIYAQAGSPQYVVVNLVDNLLEVFDGPVPSDARYSSRLVVRAEDTLHLRAPNGESLDIPARDLLP